MGLRRLFYILWVIIKYRLDELADTESAKGLPGFILRHGPWRLRKAPSDNVGERLRLALEELGPVFIKFGQILSTRRDLLPDHLADELAKLQDQVPAFPSDAAVELIETSLGKPVEQLFASFERQPMASASIAQVHGAVLHSGEEVVVKVVRPGIQPTIEKDVRLMFTLAGLVQRYIPDGKRLRPIEVVEDYRHTIIDELDLQREGANTSQLRRNFEDSPLLYVPQVYWDYSCRTVLVMERIDGIPVTDIEQLNAQGTNMKMLAERGVEIFFTQVFRDSFFHADMHPGNVFVSRKHPEEPQYMGIDCAIIGSLSDFDQYYLARNLLAIFKRDYKAVAQLHVECGWVPPDTRIPDFEFAIRSVCEPIFQKPLSEISFGHLLLYLFQVARRFDMEVQPSLVLLQKTLLNIEGLGRQLYPELDLWQTAMPFLERWMRDRYSPVNVAKRMGDQLPELLEQLPRLPELMRDNAMAERPSRNLAAEELSQLRQQTKQEKQKLNKSILSLGCIIAALLLALPADIDLQFSPLSWGLLAVGGLFLLRR